MFSANIEYENSTHNQSKTHLPSFDRSLLRKILHIVVITAQNLLILQNS